MTPKSKASPAQIQNSICVVTPTEPSLTETFIRAHIQKLPARVTLVYGWRPSIDGSIVLSSPILICYKAWRMLTGGGLERETTAAYLKVFRERKIEAVLAEYGGAGVQVMDAAERAGIPLIVHFHGYDASNKSVLEEHKKTYPQMFETASAVIAVSRAMHRKLIELGAPEEKVHYNPYGVDCERFGGADPGSAPPIFIAVGRFMEKKAPQITIAAFSRTLKACPEARLRMIGEGPLLEECQLLANQLGVEHAIEFLGGQEHSVVQAEMQRARCFIQHSVVAPSGDAEGTPVSILEAGATGLPVVSTRHAGIPDVVVEGQTGFLVDEGDEVGMAHHMIELGREPALAARMGKDAREHIQQKFSQQQSLINLWGIIQSCMNHKQIMPAPNQEEDFS
jgi:colanic acid/amylovoran biosynthesis glycosyltransferase